MKYSTYFGIDSHARTTTIYAHVPDTDDGERRTSGGNDYAEMLRWMKRFPVPAKGVYESGCTGFVPARELTCEWITVVPIATSKMPTSDDARKRKNDKRDARQLALWAASADTLKDVYVPTLEEEGLRDLCNTLEDIKENQKSSRLRIDGLLCRHGIVYDEVTKTGRPKKRWGGDFWKWLRSVRLEDKASQAALEAAIRAADSAEEQRREFERKAREIAMESSLGTTILSLTCLKGVSFITALAFCAYVGDFDRIASGRKCTAYFGLAPRESSSADKKSMGAITRSGSGLVRKLLVEGAWSIQRAKVAVRGKKPKGVDDAIWERAVTLSRRLIGHRESMVANKVGSCKANVATAAEMARFMLFLGKESMELERERREREEAA